MKLSIFKIKVFLFLLSLHSILLARQIDTFYGPIDVDEPVLLELIDHPAFQRLKLIHQYGVSYYTTHHEEYSRYDHSIGVFAILRTKGASIEEQIAGLLHDVSHTVFSHVGDWIFGKENQESDYQGSVHHLFLEQSGIGDILKQHHYTIDQILPKEELFPALENSLPNLCADRIDYNIQGAYYRGFITYVEAQIIFKDLQFVDKRWVSTHPELMKKITNFSLFMTLNCWGSPTNYLTSRWLADAILRGIDLGLISHEELHFSTDQAVWDKLLNQEDPFIAKRMRMVLNSQEYFSMVDASESDFIIKNKFRGINPWISFQSQYVRVTALDQELAEDYETARQLIAAGWPVKILSE